MECEKNAPKRHGDLHDPKLPVINGGSPESRAQGRVNPAPIPPQSTL